MRIGTRGSPLALAQTREIRKALAAALRAEESRFEIVVIRTSGDAIQDRSLAELGGKGLFTKEIDAAMLNGEIDAAVHSAKDLPSFLPGGIALVGCPLREDVREALVSARGASFAALPEGARLGTASPRRQAQAKRLRPDLRVVLLRGNVETRLRKAEGGEVDATLLACAGLKRLGLLSRATAILEIEEFLPAVGQGALALTARANDDSTIAALRSIVNADTTTAVATERAFLAALGGSCRTPIAGYARPVSGRLDFRGEVLRLDGSEAFEVASSGDAQEAVRLGDEAGRELLGRLPRDILT
ncbi:MAG TPA: hydroxymethylbilane synthase [Roseiarcus sp.]|nr:hydroxymethylbilane synthase [Roseiarcus sp.]